MLGPAGSTTPWTFFRSAPSSFRLSYSRRFSQPQATEIDEDYWYVLIRGVGKSALPSASMFVEMLWSKSPEAAVEALGDIGNDEALKRLRTLAAHAPSQFIRQLAAGIIDEWSE